MSGFTEAVGSSLSSHPRCSFLRAPALAHGHSSWFPLGNGDLWLQTVTRLQFLILLMAFLVPLLAASELMAERLSYWLQAHLVAPVLLLDFEFQKCLSHA